MRGEDTCPRLKTVFFRFYGDLNALLMPNKREKEITLMFRGRQTIKHLMESLGVPHTEVGLIVARGQPKNFSFVPAGGERVAVYPIFENMDMCALSKLRPALEEQPRFALDGHVGRLAAYLRMLGFDTLYHNHIEDGELAKEAVRGGRVLLTRDRGLLKRAAVIHGCCLLTLDPRQQLLQVVKRYGLINHMRPFSRCMSCNGRLIDIQKAKIEALLEPNTKRYFDEFQQCADCGKIYWAGSHHARMQEIIEWLMLQIPSFHTRDQSPRFI